MVIRSAYSRKYQRRWRFSWRWLLLLGIICFSLQSVTAQPVESRLPPLETHPLPTFIAAWEHQEGDYFEQVEPTQVGYLIWSHFPVKVYIETSAEVDYPSAQQQRLQQWVNQVKQAVQDWAEYFPLEVVMEEEEADIAILRLPPPVKPTIDPQTGLFDLPRARTAEIRYNFYLDQSQSIPILSHRFTITLSPDQSATRTLATARHEIGHGLGIWGHSLEETDVMYFSQVRDSPNISPRDLNTLKKIYQQPTKLGFTVQTESD